MLDKDNNSHLPLAYQINSDHINNDLSIKFSKQSLSKQILYFNSCEIKKATRDMESLT